MSRLTDSSLPDRLEEEEKDDLFWALGERVKELTCLHGAARILQNQTEAPGAILKEIVALLPPAWQYPEITAARIVLGPIEATTQDFRPSPWTQSAAFSGGQAAEGRIEIVYLETRPSSFEGPFLKEERALIQSLAQMLTSYFERQAAEARLRTGLPRVGTASEGQNLRPREGESDPSG